ncbi:MAG: hypothetical protein ABFR19_04050 [Pseudomonadota bacterium]
MPSLLSIVESPAHPNLSTHYQQLQISEHRVNSVRNALKHLKRENPDFIVAEFFYGYGNNYAGVHISNLDVLLHSLPKYAPHAKVIVLVSKAEYQYVEQLHRIYPLHGVLQYPVQPQDIVALLEIHK